MISGFQHTITLNRKIDDEASFRSSTAHAGKVELSKVSSFMPLVTPHHESKEDVHLHEIIKKKKRISSLLAC